jgi:hypothetical protein
VTAGAPRFVLYVREGCHLCDEFLLEFSLDHARLLEQLEPRDVDADPSWATEFGLRVPVLTVAGHVACEGRYDRDKVAAALGL